MTAPTGPTDLGTRLRQARERRGISLRQIATSTKISVSVLEALERNDFSKLPGGIFGRAFVRSYAQEVGVDPERTVEEFLAAQPAEPHASLSQAATRRVDQDESAFESQQRMAGVALKLALVSVPIAGLILYLPLARGGRAPASPERPAAPPSPVVRSQPVAPVAQMPLPQVPNSAVASEGQAGGPEPAPAPAPAQKDGVLLEVSPTGACWVSLTVDGSLVLSRVMQPGERVARRMREGALVQVGDAGVFAFTLNGREARRLGGPGEVKSVRITPDNYESFLR